MLEIIGVCFLFVVVIAILIASIGGGVSVSIGDINIGSNNRKKTQSK